MIKNVIWDMMMNVVMNGMMDGFINVMMSEGCLRGFGPSSTAAPYRRSASVPDLLKASQRSRMVGEVHCGWFKLVLVLEWVALGGL